MSTTTPTTFVGKSKVQATQITAIEAKNIAQDTRMNDIESNASYAVNALPGKLDSTVYTAKMEALDAKNLEQDGRLTAVEEKATQALSGAVMNSDYTAKNLEQDNRLTSVEGRVTTLETGIGATVQTAIDTKVAQTTFDSLKTQLLDADSQLSQALATKVATTVQSQTDAAQNALIESKVAQTVYTEKVASIDSSISGLLTSVSGLASSKLDASAHTSAITAVNNKIAAIEQFIQIFMTTYTITKSDGQDYSYTGSVQTL
jgi:hypothetical protein